MYVPYPNFRVGGARCLLFYFILGGGVPIDHVWCKFVFSSHLLTSRKALEA